VLEKVFDNADAVIDGNWLSAHSSESFMVSRSLANLQRCEILGEVFDALPHGTLATFVEVEEDGTPCGHGCGSVRA
jgi:hypothetical protein